MRTDFHKARHPKQFREMLDLELRQNASPHDFWAPKSSWLRDAIVASWFADKTSAKGVSLLEADRPDFAVQYRNGMRLEFEATLADLPGRRIADEHRQWDKENVSVQADTECEWRARRNAIPLALQNASDRKAKKAMQGLYGSRTNLLIYLNLATYDRWRQEIEPELVEHTQLARPHFNSVWVLWNERLYRTWPEPFIGNAGALRPELHDLGQAFRQHRNKAMFTRFFSREAA